MSPPLASVLIDTYNHERYIEQALVSVLEQGLSRRQLEIVVVDDGSTDKTPEIIQKFAPQVKHVRKKNGGQASAFNAGFGETHGEIVATLDGDDWWAKGKLQTVIDALETHPEVAAVGHGYYEFHDKTKETLVRAPASRVVVNLGTPEAISAALNAWPFLPMGALTVRRKVLEWILPLPEELVFMADSALQVGAMFFGALVLEEPLFYYRHHSQNMFSIDTRDAPRLRRRNEMADLVYRQLQRMLTERGVPSESVCALLYPNWIALNSESVCALLYPNWIALNRSGLRALGDSRLRAFRTEMRAFHFEYKHPSMAYRLFKYLLVGAATLALSPRRFYQIRDLYAEKQLGHLRDRFCKADVTNASRP